jgi:hypothetical protein
MPRQSLSNSHRHRRLATLPCADRCINLLPATQSCILHVVHLVFRVAASIRSCIRPSSSSTCGQKATMALMLSRGLLAFLLLVLVLVTANGSKCGHPKHHRPRHHAAPAPAPTGPSSTAAPAPAPTFGGMSPVTTPVPLSGAEAPAPSPAGADHSNGAAVTLFAWQSVVLGAAGVAATMI